MELVGVGCCFAQDPQSQDRGHQEGSLSRRSLVRTHLPGGLRTLKGAAQHLLLVAQMLLDLSGGLGVCGDALGGGVDDQAAPSRWVPGGVGEVVQDPLDEGKERPGPIEGLQMRPPAWCNSG